MARTRARLAIGATGKHRSQQSDRRGHCRLALLARPRILFLTSNRLADFAGYGCQDPPCWQLGSKRFLVFKSSRHCPRKFRFVWARLPFGQFLDLGCSIHASGFFNLPSPPPSNRAWAENIRFDKRIVFPNSFFCLTIGRIFSCRSRRDKDRCVRFLVRAGDLAFSLRRVLPLSFGAPAQNTATAGRS